MQSRHGQSERWLTAWVGDLPLALPLDRVREVILWIPWQPVPPDRSGMVGMLTLRDSVCPVWDIRRMWGWPPREPDPETSLVLMNAPGGDLRGAVVVDRSGWVLDGAPTDLGAETGGALAAGAPHAFTQAVRDADAGVHHYVLSLTELLG